MGAESTTVEKTNPCYPLHHISKPPIPLLHFHPRPSRLPLSIPHHPQDQMKLAIPNFHLDGAPLYSRLPSPRGRGKRILLNDPDRNCGVCQLFPLFTQGKRCAS